MTVFDMGSSLGTLTKQDFVNLFDIGDPNPQAFGPITGVRMSPITARPLKDLPMNKQYIDGGAIAIYEDNQMPEHMFAMLDKDGKIVQIIDMRPKGDKNDART